MLKLGPDSYFGDTSYLFNLKNKYVYQFNNYEMFDKEKKPLSGPYIFSILDEKISSILT